MKLPLLDLGGVVAVRLDERDEVLSVPGSLDLRNGNHVNKRKLSPYSTKEKAPEAILGGFPVF